MAISSLAITVRLLRANIVAKLGQYTTGHALNYGKYSNANTMPLQRDACVKR